jgi:glycosyltransferase involved in cell wall biosynthesis
MKWDSEEIIRVYVHTPRWFVRPSNTDWKYTRFVIPRLAEFVPDCAFYPAKSVSTAVEANGRYLNRRLLRSLGVDKKTPFGTSVDKKEFACKKCQIVFTHDEFPKNGESFPIVWQNSILDPHMMLAYGMPQNAFEALVEAKQKGFHKAAAVQVSTEAERDRLSKWFPELAPRFVAIPFFLPDVTSIGDDDFSRKNERRGTLRCLFIGHEARRKGLERVYDAMALLPESVSKRIHLTVISKGIGGRVIAPPIPNLRVERQLPYSKVQQLMKECDVFVMPSFFESYGLVYLEAMAQGTIPMVPNWEVQREIVDAGKAGIITNGGPEEIATRLAQLCDDDNLRRRLATNARQRFQDRFAAPVVASQFRSLFRKFGTQ